MSPPNTAMSLGISATSTAPGRLQNDTMKMSFAGHGLDMAGDAQPFADALRNALQETDTHRLDLARRLHGNVAGNLVACTAVIEMIRHQLAHAGGQPGIAGMLTGIDSTLRQTLQFVRELNEEQLPPVLTAFGLGAALQQFVKQVGGGFSGSLVLHLKEEELGLDHLRRLHLFRVLQMILTRIVCHARATWVEVTCAGARGGLECTIDHDGDTSLWTDAGARSELATITARCALLGCALHLAPSPTGTGQRMRLHVPA